MDLDDISVNELRNIAMSYTPESDIKIFTFMFRSDLSRHISSVLFLIGLIGILSFCTKGCLEKHIIFEVEKVHLLYYILMIICSFLLLKTYSRFLSIALRIPFSIFISKLQMDDN